MHQHFGVADIPFSFLNSMTWLKTIEAIVSATGGKKQKTKNKIPDWERANFRLVSQKLFDLFSQTFELVSWHFEILKSKRWDTDLKFWLLGGKIFSFVFFFSFFKFRGGNKLPQKTALKRTAVEILSSGGRCCHYVGRKRFIVGHVVLHTNYGHFIAFNFLWATWNNFGRWDSPCIWVGCKV